MIEHALQKLTPLVEQHPTATDRVIDIVVGGLVVVLELEDGLASLVSTRRRQQTAEAIKHVASSTGRITPITIGAAYLNAYWGRLEMWEALESGMELYRRYHPWPRVKEISYE